MAAYVFMDTCVWVSAAGTPNMWPVLDELHDQIAKGKIVPITSPLLVAELDKHIVETPAKAITAAGSHLKEVRTTAKRCGDKALIDQVSKAMDALNAELAKQPEGMKKHANQILADIKCTSCLSINSSSDAIRLSSAERALARKAPCHKSAQMADCIHVETVLQAARELRRGGHKGLIYFVSENHHEFSDPENHNAPHKDLKDEFTALQIEYSRNFAEVLQHAGLTVSAEQVELVAQDVAARGHNGICKSCGMPMAYMFGMQADGSVEPMFICFTCGTHVRMADDDEEVDETMNWTSVPPTFHHHHFL